MRKDDAQQPPAEANLADRVKREREARGLSLEGLAKLLTDAGRPTHGSAIYKIERGTRRITVAELVALADVFAVEPAELLRPVDLLDRERAEQILSALDDAGQRLGALVTDLLALYGEYFVLAESDPEIHEYVRGHRAVGAEWRVGLNEPDGSRPEFPWPRIGPGRMPDGEQARIVHGIPSELHDDVEQFEYALVTQAIASHRGTINRG